METGLFLLLSLLFLPHIHCENNDRVLLRDIQVLTLYKGHYTTTRRTSPVPQLQCVGGSAGCSSLILYTVQCRNTGWDGATVHWECKAEMEKSYQFGQIHVTCEGYTGPKDPYVLRGSCGLKYTLERTTNNVLSYVGISVLIGLCLLVLCCCMMCRHTRSNQNYGTTTTSYHCTSDHYHGGTYMYDSGTTTVDMPDTHISTGFGETSTI